MLKKLLISTLCGSGLFMINTLAFANEASAGGGSSVGAFAVAIAAFGGAIGQGLAIFSALSGISRNPSAGDKMFTPMMLGLVFIETLTIFTFAMVLMLK